MATSVCNEKRESLCYSPLSVGLLFQFHRFKIGDFFLLQPFPVYSIEGRSAHTEFGFNALNFPRPSEDLPIKVFLHNSTCPSGESAKGRHIYFFFAIAVPGYRPRFIGGKGLVPTCFQTDASPSYGFFPVRLCSHSTVITLNNTFVLRAVVPCALCFNLHPFHL